MLNFINEIKTSSASKPSQLKIQSTELNYYYFLLVV